MMTENDRAWAFGGGIFFGSFLLGASSWAGAAAGAVLTGEDSAPANVVTVYRMATDFAGVWPHSQTASAIGAVLLDVAVIALVVWGLRWAFRWYRNPSHLATLHQMRELTPKHAAKKATQLRASLKGLKPKDVAPADRGVLLGNHLPSKVELRGSDEDTYVAIMAPRAGKSTALAIPVAEEAPGALLMTSNKADVYAATLASRSRIGTTWVFDTQGVAQAERIMWWDMIAQAETLEGAERLASHFVAQISSEQADPFWSQSAQDLLVGLFRAAWWDGGTVRDVMKWLADPREKAPLRILYANEPVLAEQVDSSVNIAEETQSGAQSGVFQNARTAMSALGDEKVLAWVTPDERHPRFNPEHFATSKDTLYLLSKKGGPTSALVAALADAVFTAAAEAGERAGGRLPEPMRAVLDEAANICKIADNNLAGAYAAVGDLGRAVPLYERVLGDRERLLGADHPHTLATRGGLADAYEAAGDLKRAIPLYEQTLADRERVLGAGSPLTVVSGNDLAEALVAAGRPDQALPVYEQALRNAARNLGDTHELTCTVRHNLAATHARRGNLDLAVPLLEQNLDATVRSVGEDHPNTGAVRLDLAAAYEATGRTDLAVGLTVVTVFFLLIEKDPSAATPQTVAPSTLMPTSAPPTQSGSPTP